MSASIISQIPKLQPHSGKRLNRNFVWRMLAHMNTHGIEVSILATPHLVANANWKSKLKNPPESLFDPTSRQARRKVRTLPAPVEDNFTFQLNTALLGGTRYPVLDAVVGAALGAVSGGAGLLFTIGSTALTLSLTSQRVLARGGDEVWYVQEIGRAGEGSDARLECVTSFFLVDPYRRNARQQGWLIHEERSEVLL